MPNKTLYIKDSDLPLFEQAQHELGESISSLFADFLKQRVASLSPAEHRIADLIHRIGEERESAVSDRNVPSFVAQEFADAQAYAERSLKSLRSGDVRKAKALFYVANTYTDRARRDAVETAELSSKLASLIGPEPKKHKTVRKARPKFTRVK
jgi:hypothetical protein